MNVQLYKGGITHKGGEADLTTIRYIYIPDVQLQFSEDHIERIKSASESGTRDMYSEAHTLSLSHKDDVYKLNDAYKVFEKAEEVFKKAQLELAKSRKEFMKTDAGQSIEALMYPSKIYKMCDLITEEQDAAIRIDAEKLGEIVSWCPYRKGYSRAFISIKFKEYTGPTYENCVKFNSNGFKCHEVGYISNSDRHPLHLTIKNIDGKLEAPHLIQDYVEFKLYNSIKHAIYEKRCIENVIDETLASIVQMGYNRGDYEETSVRIRAYAEAKFDSLNSENH